MVIGFFGDTLLLIISPRVGAQERRRHMKRLAFFVLVLSALRRVAADTGPFDTNGKGLTTGNAAKFCTLARNLQALGEAARDAAAVSAQRAKALGTVAPHLAALSECEGENSTAFEDAARAQAKAARIAVLAAETAGQAWRVSGQLDSFLDLMASSTTKEGASATSCLTGETGQTLAFHTNAGTRNTLLGQLGNCKLHDTGLFAAAEEPDEEELDKTLQRISGVLANLAAIGQGEVSVGTAVVGTAEGCPTFSKGAATGGGIFAGYTIAGIWTHTTSAATPTATIKYDTHGKRIIVDTKKKTDTLRALIAEEWPSSIEDDQAHDKETNTAKMSWKAVCKSHMARGNLCDPKRTTRTLKQLSEQLARCTREKEEGAQGTKTEGTPGDRASTDKAQNSETHRTPPAAEGTPTGLSQASDARKQEEEKCTAEGMKWDTQSRTCTREQAAWTGTGTWLLSVLAGTLATASEMNEE
ncbi:hypothetical protein, conserved in T. vivax [Trypanosoma vivax Y486]|uniref:Uncharacterized protein n=1 Tax=Trypanosoma vivax (strain Y486) TaxID=1055687 RepID=F9WP11_TRYVY|nr:hypothetical protein, conserved in T. vivax [Trypanosoma vivax Y486]|eukprot:CCD19284.1 hypothetical protein, conserved in T. vivax [Trypanosoma vivax Y486]